MEKRVLYSEFRGSGEKAPSCRQCCTEWSTEKDRNLERATLVYTLGHSKGICTGMRRASLRVIIRVPEVGDANKREGGAIVGVWVHTSGWFIDLKASETRRGGGRHFG